MMVQTLNPLKPLVAFAWHLGSYLVVSLAFFAFHWLTGEAPWWYWPALGGAVGVCFHGTNLLFKILRLVTGGYMPRSPLKPAVEFLEHLTAFVIVGLFLLAVNWLTTPNLWAPVPMGFWGIGLVIHGIVAGFQTLGRLAGR
jgi:hypothetical protein